MKIKYYKEDDILVFKLSDKPYDHAEMQGNFIVHFTKNEQPVRIEILNAHSFLEEQAKALPRDVKNKYFAPTISKDFL